MTKEQAISKLWEDLSAIRDKYFLEEYYPSYWKIKEGFEHESQVIGGVLYFLDELTPSGSVAAPKEEPNDDKSWLYEQYNLTHDQVKDNEISLLYTKWNKAKDELAAAKESIKALYKISQQKLYETEVNTVEFDNIKSVLDQAQKVLG